MCESDINSEFNGDGVSENEEGHEKVEDSEKGDESDWGEEMASGESGRLEGGAIFGCPGVLD